MSKKEPNRIDSARNPEYYIDTQTARQKIKNVASILWGLSIDLSIPEDELQALREENKLLKQQYDYCYKQNQQLRYRLKRLAKAEKTVTQEDGL